MFRRMTMLLAALLVASVGAGPLAAADLGDDGLHKPDWLRETFKDLREDLEEANADGRRLLLMFEQRGCIYCTRAHQEIYPHPEIDALIREKYFVVQMNLFGDVEVTDFDGETLSEKDMARKWGVMFTPTLLFLPEAVAEGATAGRAAVVTMPGAFGKATTRNLLQWVLDHGYDGEEGFQRYLARMMVERPMEE